MEEHAQVQTNFGMNTRQVFYESWHQQNAIVVIDILN